MKDFFYGGVHKKTNNSTWLEEEENIKQTEEFRKNFDNASYKEKRRALLAKEDAKEKGIEFVTPKHSPYDKKHKVKRKENLSFITRKYFPYMQNDSEEFITKRNEIASANHILDPAKIYIEQELLIPISEEEHQKTEKYYQDKLIQADKDKSSYQPSKTVSKLSGADKEARDGKILAEKYGLSLNIINAGVYKERDVKEMILRNVSKILFISTHGNPLTDKKTEERVQGVSTIELTTEGENDKADDGFLSVEELNKLGALNDLYLLFLNACTSASKDIKNESTASRLLKDNQVENVIGSYWNIDDEFTYLFAVAFIENLAKDKNMDVAKALRTTQLQALIQSREAQKLFDIALQKKEIVDARADYDSDPDPEKRQYLQDLIDKESIKIAMKGPFYIATYNVMEERYTNYQQPYYWAAYQHLGKKYNRKDYTLEQTIQDIELNGVNIEQIQVLQGKLKQHEAIVDIRLLSRHNEETQLYQAIIITEKSYQKMDITDESESLANSIRFHKTTGRYDEMYNQSWGAIEVILEKYKISKIYLATQGRYNQLNFNALWDNKTNKYIFQKYAIQLIF